MREEIYGGVEDQLVNKYGHLSKEAQAKYGRGRVVTTDAKEHDTGKNHFPVIPTEIDHPRWKMPITWQLHRGDELSPGDAIISDRKVYIIAQKLRWRRKCANLLCHEVNDPSDRCRVGTVDYLKSFKGYVRCQQLAMLNIDVEDFEWKF